MPTPEKLLSLIEPIIEPIDAEIYDLEYIGGVLKVTLDREGGIDLETIAEATRRISREFDLLDPISSKYTLEVSSPGLERVLRTEDHWRRAMGSLVQVKLKRHAEGERRVDGEIRSIEEGVATLALDGGELLQVHLDDVDRAKTRLLWGPEARTSQSPSGGGKRGAANYQAGKKGAANSGAVQSEVGASPSNTPMAETKKSSTSDTSEVS